MNRYPWFLALLILLGSSSSMAASITATFEIAFESGFFSDSPNAETRRKITPIARQEIWKVYAGRQDTSARPLILAKKDEIQKSLEELITDIKFEDEHIDKNAKIMRIRVRAVVNDNLVTTLITSGGAKSGEGSLFGFLILPRIQLSAKVFEATIEKKASATTSLVSEKIESDQVSESEGGASERSIKGDKVTTTASAKTSGSTTRTAQKAKWAVGEAKDVDTNITKYLTEAGYEPSTYADLASDCQGPKTKDVRDDMLQSDSGELSDDIRALVIKAMRKCESKFFAVGTLDFDSIEPDRNSGGVRARASVNVKVSEFPPAPSTRPPRSVASVGPIYFFGSGPTEDVARAEALVLASKQAAQLIVNQLRSKNIK